MKDLIAFLKELWARLFVSTPTFFRKIRDKALWVFGTCLIVWSSHKMGVYEIPHWKIFGVEFITLIEEGAKIGGLIALIAQSTAKPDAPSHELEEKLQKLSTNKKQTS